MYTQESLSKYLKPVAFAPHEERSDRRYIVDEIGRRLSTVSNRYTIVQNAEVIQPVVDYFGIEKISTIKIYNSCKSIMLQFNTGKEYDIGGGDIIKEKFMVGNSYDKSRSFWFLAAAYRKVCANGLYTTFGNGVEYRKIHVGVIPVHELVHQALNNFKSNNFSFWRRLKEIPLTVESQIELVSLWKPFGVEDESNTWAGNAPLNRWIKDKAVSLLAKPESLDNQRNAWGLYNQMNQAIASNISQNNIDKRISGNKLMEDYLKATLHIN